MSRSGRDAPGVPARPAVRNVRPVSISPPSDIVLDVAQAADPTRLQAATAKLARMAAGQGGDGFAAALGSATDAVHVATSRAAPPSPFGPLARRAMPTLSPYQKFEALMLQNFVQNILPKDEDLFGDAASADITRSMLAEQVANQIARSGRIGIAKMIEHAHGGLDKTKPGEPQGLAQPGAATSAVDASAAATGPGLAALSSMAGTKLIAK